MNLGVKLLTQAPEPPCIGSRYLTKLVQDVIEACFLRLYIRHGRKLYSLIHAYCM